jgi:hypothetical protein
VRFPERRKYQINSSDFIALKERIGIFIRRRRIKEEREHAGFYPERVLGYEVITRALNKLL